MERFRPHIPLSVRVQVTNRQAHVAGIYSLRVEAGPAAWVLASNLRLLFGEGTKVHLDHNPALILRPFNKRTGKYKPDANDPDFLIYRTKHDHHIKTHQRGDGAQFSDTTLRNRERRRDRPKKKAKPIQSQSQWPPKGSRKIRNRGFERAAT